MMLPLYMLMCENPYQKIGDGGPYTTTHIDAIMLPLYMLMCENPYQKIGDGGPYTTTHTDAIMLPLYMLMCQTTLSKNPRWRPLHHHMQHTLSLTYVVGGRPSARFPFFFIYIEFFFFFLNCACGLVPLYMLMCETPYQKNAMAAPTSTHATHTV